MSLPDKIFVGGGKLIVTNKHIFKNFWGKFPCCSPWLWVFTEGYVSGMWWLTEMSGLLYFMIQIQSFFWNSVEVET